MAGIVVQAVFPPLAIAIDATAYMASASVISRIRQNEVIKPSTASVWHDLKEGLAVILKEKRLSPIVGSTATKKLFFHVKIANLLLFLVQKLVDIVFFIVAMFFI